MGLAAYGKPREDLYDLFRSMIEVDGLDIRFTRDAALVPLFNEAPRPAAQARRAPVRGRRPGLRGPAGVHRGVLRVLAQPAQARRLRQPRARRRVRAELLGERRRARRDRLGAPPRLQRAGRRRQRRRRGTARLPRGSPGRSGTARHPVALPRLDAVGRHAGEGVRLRPKSTSPARPGGGVPRTAAHVAEGRTLAARPGECPRIPLPSSPRTPLNARGSAEGRLAIGRKWGQIRHPHQGQTTAPRCRCVRDRCLQCFDPRSTARPTSPLVHRASSRMPDAAGGRRTT